MCDIYSERVSESDIYSERERESDIYSERERVCDTYSVCVCVMYTARDAPGVLEREARQHRRLG